MVLQKAQQMIDNLKERPKDDKKLIAGGIAIIVVIILFFGWAYLFLNKIQNSDQSIELSSVVQDTSLSDVARQAQQELQQGFSGFDEVKELRAQLEAQQSSGASMQYNQSGDVIPLNPQ
ncbi:MAG: hypothetical protein UY61_C0080G0009 [Candidatus Adlerbacteria bacterium GW2011_GWC1_50_9]|uniref:Uncharacterized protein n=1 Tax=Candidatus Adlerbacteria bacterium GW2011_GWC1_50_9 TaxID=1618608 RepID=A0A0G1WIF2_9BACT|nr:MAG: hypothetical protein UY61_C0080G0009 [Candidatus Adlerbacteria bacterium GW2011_GWC1_50_9]